MGAPSGRAQRGEFAYKAAEHDIMLGPGHLFSVDLAPGPWMRFNVAFCTDGVVFAFLRSQDWRAGGSRRKACAAGSSAASQRAAATRQTVLPTSSATSSAPAVQRDTDRAAPGAPLSFRKPARNSTGGPEGRPFANGTNTTL